jgi:protein-disulfide isomerase
MATFEFRNHPILGDASVLAAEASRCAEDQGRFWEYHDLIFYNVDNSSLDGLSRASLDLFAQYLDLDMTAFAACMDEHTHQAELIAEREEATALGVGGTPTVALNGEIVTGIESYGELFDMIEEAAAAQ